MTGRVVGIYTAAGADAPMRAHAEVEVVAGKGIPGDRYAEGGGTFKDQVYANRALTLVERESAEAVGLPPEALRRNVVVEGVRLVDLLGRPFRLGGARLFAARKCAPCGHLERVTGRPGLKATLDGGLRADVLASGKVRVGDALVPEGA